MTKRDRDEMHCLREKFGCTREELIEAAGKVGVIAEDVREALCELDSEVP